MLAALFCLALAGARVSAYDQQLVNATGESVVQEGKHMRINLNETGSEELLEKWLGQAISGLMAAVASKQIDSASEDVRSELHRCSQAAHDVPQHARCVVKMLDAKKNSQRHVKVAQHSEIKYKQQKDDLHWISAFGTRRAKRQSDFKIVSRESYRLRSNVDESPMVSVAKSLTKTVRAFKNKDGRENWREAISRVKKLGEQAKEEKKRRAALKKRLRLMIDNTPPEFLDPRKPIAMEQAEKQEKQDEMSMMMRKKKSEEVRVPIKLMRDAVKVALQLGGQNTTDFDKKTLKMISPRFMSAMPEQDDDSLINLLSPSLFSLHDKGTGIEKLTSLPNILKRLHNNDQEAWMDFIVEAAGVSDTIDIAKDELRAKKESELRGDGGVPLYFNKKNATEILGEKETSKIEVFEFLDKTYSEKQKADLDTKGYSFLSKDQLKQVYGKRSPYNNTRTLKRFLRMRDDPEKLIETDIRALAEAEKFKVRRNDIVASPFVLTPLTYASAPLSNTFVVLSPLVLSPITLSPAVLGPIILSPWVFVPLVLSPRVLSPLILTPLVFSPIILSPLVLHPLILVPGIFNPLILSPLLLSPLILSPQVFTPLILTPFALSPLILTPMVGSPLILSPFVLSPIILSPQALFAVILSPYALSPLVESKLIAAEVILSPSWLS